MQRQRVGIVAAVMSTAQFCRMHIDPSLAAGVPPPDFGIVVEIMIVLRDDPIIRVQIEMRFGRIIPRWLGANLINRIGLGFELDPVLVAGLTKVEQHRTGEDVREQGTIIWLVAILAIGLHRGEFFIVIIVFASAQGITGRLGWRVNSVRECDSRVKQN